MVFEIDGIDARLERAKENIINLTGEISAFLRGVCDGLVASEEPPIPSRLGAWAGESIYLMRSALDHLAWQLVIAAGGEPGPRTAFPVFALDPARNEVERYAERRLFNGAHSRRLIGTYHRSQSFQN